MIAIILGLAVASASVTPPVPLEVGGIELREDDYPPSELRKSIEGHATARLTIEADGIPSKCIITKSTRNAALDAATCRVFMRARFHPGLDAQRRPTRAEVVKTIGWQVQEDTLPAAFKDQTSITHIDLSETRQIIGCSITSHAVAPLPDGLCSIFNNADAAPAVLAIMIGRSLSGLRAVDLRIDLSVGPHADVPLAAVDGADTVILGTADYEVSRLGVVMRCLEPSLGSATARGYALCSAVDNSVVFEPDQLADEPRRVRATVAAVSYRSAP